jgi:hypothetical protein
MINLKGYGWQRQWLNFTSYHSIYLEGLRKTTEILIEIVYVPTEIQTGCLSNTRQKSYHFIQCSWLFHFGVRIILSLKKML